MFKILTLLVISLLYPNSLVFLVNLLSILWTIVHKHRRKWRPFAASTVLDSRSNVRTKEKGKREICAMVCVQEGDFD